MRLDPIKPINHHCFSREMEVLQKHLIDSRVDETDLEEKIIPHFWKKGFKKIADFEFLEEKDVDGIVLKVT